MSIQVQDLLTSKSRKFGASEESVQFQYVFLDALNNVLGDIENVVGEATSKVSRASETIDLDEMDYRQVMSIGLDFYIGESAEYTVQSLESLERKYKNALRVAHSIYFVDQSPDGILGDLDD